MQSKKSQNWVTYNFQGFFFLIIPKDLYLSSARSLGRWAICQGKKALCYHCHVQREMLTGQALHPTPVSGFAWTGF